MHGLGLLSPRGKRRGGPKDSPPVESDGEPKTAEGIQKLLEGNEGSWCCPTWLDIQRCAAAARLWLRCSWKGTQGWSIPEGEACVDVETKTSDTPLDSAGYCFFQNNCPRAAESSWRTPRVSPHTCTGFEPWEANSKDSQALPSLCQEGSGTEMPPSRAGHHSRRGQGTCPVLQLLLGMGENAGKGAALCATEFLQQLLCLGRALSSASAISYCPTHSHSFCAHKARGVFEIRPWKWLSTDPRGDFTSPCAHLP